MKLTSLLNQKRQEMLGIEQYIWRTSKDDAVVGKPGGLYPNWNNKHHNHWIMEGVRCRWDDATVYSRTEGRTWIKRTGPMPKDHPGQEIQCRCYGEAVIDMQKLLEYAVAA